MSQQPRLYDHRSYHAYLRSAAWRALRFAKMMLAGWSCEVVGCDEPCTEVHHLTYERLGYEYLEDLICLCRRHHVLMRIDEYERKRGLRAHRLGKILPMAVQRQLPLEFPSEEEESEDDQGMPPAA